MSKSHKKGGLTFWIRFPSVLGLVLLSTFCYPSVSLTQHSEVIAGSLEQDLSENAGATYLLPNDMGLEQTSQALVQSLVSETSSYNQFMKWKRLTAEEQEWVDMENETHYFRDPLAGALTYIANAQHGDTWHFVATLEDGSDITSHNIWYYDTWLGEHYLGGTQCSTSPCQWCFVAPNWYVCGLASIYIQWWATSQCAPTGEWLWEFHNNDAIWHVGQTSLLPRIPPGKVLLDDQFAYSQPYDDLCSSPQLPPGPDWYFKCGFFSNNPSVIENPVPISNQGCYLTAVTMLLTYHGVSVRSDQLNQWLIDNYGYTDKGFVKPEAVVTYADTVANVKMQYRGRSNAGSIEDYICDYGPQVTSLSGSRHWVTPIGTDISKTNYLIDDPLGGIERSIPYSDIDAKTDLYVGPDYVWTDRTSLIVYFNSPGELLITDPQGRSTGIDPLTTQSFSDIPGSSYDTIGRFNALTGELSSELSKVLHIPRPIGGDYAINITGTGDGAYTLEMFAYDPERNETKAVFMDIPIYTDQVHTYNLSYEKVVGSEIKVSGIYAGQGQRPRDVNKFLSYSNPTETSTTLPAGTAAFPIQILYGAEVIPSSFEAKLNGVDISSSFHPAASSSEIVPIGLQSGRNVLLLSVSGNLASRVANDKDRLVFKVQ